MKRMLFFIVGLIFYTGISAQYADSLSHKAQELFLKANKQKSAGWILLGGGAGMAAAGLLVGSVSIWDNIVEGDDTGTNIGGALMLTGLAGMVGSIPVFIASGKNKKKAATMVFMKMENSSYMNQYTITEKKYPAVVLRVDF